jgi:nicotinamidase-related amidase
MTRAYAQHGVMRHPSLLDPERALVVLIDVQEAYRSVLHGWEDVLRHVEVLLRGAYLLGIPVLVTEQYPKGLGHTAAEAVRWLPQDTAILEKQSMSCCGSEQFVERLRASGRRQIVVAGIETHACVNQTVHDLLALGYEVHVVRDTTSSRRATFVAPAWERMMRAGALPTSVEQSLLELVRTAASPHFKALQQLLKEL